MKGQGVVRSARETSTASDAIRPVAPETRTRAFSLQAAELHDKARIVHEDASQLHEDVRDVDLRQRTAIKARKSVPELLSELSDARGVSWTDIASLVGVSVSAVRKWRRGGDATGQSRHALAQLAAFLDLLEELPITDPASWMEVPLPLPPGYLVTPIDLYSEGHVVKLLDIAAQRAEPESVLTQVRPKWREEMRTHFEAVAGPDGQSVIQQR